MDGPVVKIDLYLPSSQRLFLIFHPPLGTGQTFTLERIETAVRC